MPGITRKPDLAADNFEQIIPLTFKTISLERVELERLVAFRKREAKGSGHHYRALRHLYPDELEKYLAKAAMYAVGTDDRNEIDRVFEAKMEDDLRDLKDELGFAKRDALLSKDTIVFVLAGIALAGAVIVTSPIAPIAIPAALTLTGAPITIGGMMSTNNKYASKRREVLRKHPMAYMYEISEY